MADETIQCGQCGREQKTKPIKDGMRLPPGWKRTDAVYCKGCWSEAYVLRAVTLPVAGVAEGGEWSEFWDALKAGWSAATDIANWAVTELARNDTPRTADAEKLATMPRVYLYPGARKVAPALDPSSVVALLHAIEGRYRKARLATMWFRSAAHPVYRYPMPIPIHNQSWSCVEGDGGRPSLSIRLGGRRWVLALATAQHHRQLGAWRQILAGAAVAGELSLLAREVTGSDRRRAGEKREAGGGRRRSLRVMAKMVAWFPRREEAARDGVLYVRTDAEHLLVYHVGTDGEPAYWDAAHARRRQGQHRRHLDSLAHDAKAEKRMPSIAGLQIGERRELWARKYRDRIDSLCHETTAIVANFADRRRIATVVYDDTCKSYLDQFPWHKLRDQLRYKLNERGIALEVVAKSDTGGEGDSSAETPAKAG
jgi:hypothetical protein